MSGKLQMFTYPGRLAAILALILVGAAGLPAVGHSPTVDAILSDWCLFGINTTSRFDGLGNELIKDEARQVTCGFGSETIWFDGRADGAVNDLATVATTQDGTNLYWAAELHVDPDPVSLPFAQIAIDVGGAGSNTWWDPTAKMKTAGRCSGDPSRACTENKDCYFCAVSKIYVGTPDERPRQCGSTEEIPVGSGLEYCDENNLADACIDGVGAGEGPAQTCLNLSAGPAAPNVGLSSDPDGSADYLLVFDFSRWVLNFCDITELRRNNGGVWQTVPRSVPDLLCDDNVIWRFEPAVDPGAQGGSGGPPGKIELAVPWQAFTEAQTGCAGCPAFGQGTDFRWTLEVNRGTLNADFIPDGAVEDVMSEKVAGTTTTTRDYCWQDEVDATDCEIADGTMDAFVPLPLTGPAGGRLNGLVMSRVGVGGASTLTATWGQSCTTGDTDYGIYEGTLGSWYSHTLKLCSTGGLRTSPITPGVLDHYYLVVPNNQTVEGSYGRDSTPAERPNAGGGSCWTAAGPACP